MRNLWTGAALALAVICAPVTQAGTAEDLQELKTEAKTGATAKLGSTLLALKRAQPTQGIAAARAQPRFRPAGLLTTEDGYVRVSAYGPDPAALQTQLVSKGMLDARVHKYSVSGRVPIAGLDDIAKTDGLRFLKPAMATTHAGLVTSQGDRALRSNIARAQFGVSGKGVRVGVLSDSYDCAPGPFAPGQRFTRAAEDIANKDLPADIHVLSDLSSVPSADCSDEGRAMMQIIHDVAPGASQSFHTAFVSEEDFAAGIIRLADDGAQVIVDDIIYFAEPMFENGMVADSVNAVKARGVTYFSAAGNQGRLSYESQFRLTDDFGFDGPRHDFDAGTATDTLQHVTIPSGGNVVLAVNWDEPSLSANGIRGSRSDVDVIFYEMDGTPVIDCDFIGPFDEYCQFTGLSSNEGFDAVELTQIINVAANPLEVQVSIELYSGPAPTQLKYVWFDFGEPMIVNELDTRSGTVFGHGNAEGAEAVGGAWWFDTAAYGAANHPKCNFACVNEYSSAGGTPILFDDEGLRKAKPFVGFKPGITGPDGVNTSFFFVNSTTPAPGEPDDFPNFFGTSAAAPHIAAVAALMLEQRACDIRDHRKRPHAPKPLTPDQIIKALRLSADDIKLRALLTRDPAALERIENSKGFDFDSGFGFVNVPRALKIARDLK